MCRLLALYSPTPIAVRPALVAFAAISKASTEFQGHGWGFALRDDAAPDPASRWVVHREITPVWESTLIPATDLCGTLLLAHARSAFRDEGIAIENNMPFVEDGTVFIFNGELHGVRLREEGRIGAEKIFHFLRRFESAGVAGAVERGEPIIAKQSRYVRAMNLMLSDGRELAVSSRFGEAPEYFTMHRRGFAERPGDGGFVICSDPWPGSGPWEPIPSGSIERLAVS